MQETPVTNRRPTRSPADARYRGLVIIWGVVLLNLCAFVLLMRLINSPEPGAGGGRSLLTALSPVVFGAFVLSFVMKSLFLSRSRNRRSPETVTSGYVVAFALCEACAVLGFVAYLVTGAREAFYFFIPSALGMLLHFPRRRHLDDATGDASRTFKTTF
jgi:F0F1-type ATP synthase membrane subunit c/vacuolar-type H+-ATPase subunit K